MKKVSSAPAFALIESIISASIFIIGLTGLVSTLGLVANQAAVSRDQAMASQVVRDTVEELLIKPSNHTVGKFNYARNGARLTDDTGAYFVVDVTSSNISITGVATLQRLEATATWGQFPTHSIKLVTLRN